MAITACGFLAAVSGFGSPAYRIERWKTEQGLPQTTIRCLLQTRDGYVWIGTASGLVRYDGRRFVVFDRGNTPELPDDNCVALAEGRDGALWVGTENGLFRWHGDRLTSWRAGLTNSPDSLAHNVVRALALSRDGGLWIGTANGLDLFRGGQFTHFTTNDGLQANNIRAVIEEAAGRVWVGTEMKNRIGGLQWLDPGSDKFVAMPGYGTNALFTVHNFLEDKAGRVWWGNNAGLHCFSNGVQTDFHGADGLATETVRRVAPCRGGGMLILTHREGGVTRHDELHKFKDGRITRIDLAKLGLEGDLISAIEDEEGGIWVGTRYDGLIRLQARLFRTFTTQDGLRENNVNSVCEEPGGAIWASTDGGLCEIRQDQVVEPPRYECGSSAVRSVQVDGLGRLWAAAPKRRVFGFGAASRGPQLDFLLAENAPVTEFTSLGRDAEGAVWVSRPGTAWRLEATAGSGGGTLSPRILRRVDGLPAAEIRAILCDRAGNVWFGTSGAGLCRLSPGHSNEVTEANPGFGSRPVPARSPGLERFTKRDGLCSDFVRGLCEDRNGTIWIGTDNGLACYREGRFDSLNRSQGLLDDRIHQLLADDFDSMWIGSNRGLIRVSIEELNLVAEGRRPAVNAVVFGEADGLPSSEVSGTCQPAACKAQDGRLWFPTIKGVAVIDPRDLPLNSLPPPVVIEEVRANDRVVSGDRRRTGLTPGMLESSSLPDGKQSTRPQVEPRTNDGAARRLPAGSGHLLEIRYTANSFAAPDKVRFRYRLDGYDQEWRSDSNNRRVAFYTNLRPGDYSFQVKACNNHGVWNEQGAVFRFQIEPFFYQTRTFYFACALGIVLAGLGLHRLRVHGLTRVQQLEKQIALDQERARIAHDIHDDLGSRLTQLSVLRELADRNLEVPDRARTQLEKLRTATSETFAALDEIVWAVNPQQDSLAGLGSYLREFSAGMLSGAGLQCRLDFPESLPDHALTAELRHDVFLTVKEALNNVLKHAHATKVWLRLGIQDTTFSLGIEDDGRGFDPALVSSAVADGLRNMRERVVRHRGQFELQSAPGQGTRIRLTIPL